MWKTLPEEKLINRFRQLRLGFAMPINICILSAVAFPYFCKKAKHYEKAFYYTNLAFNTLLQFFSILSDLV